MTTTTRPASDSRIRLPVPPPPVPPSAMGYTVDPPAMRAAELPGMASVRVHDLFPDTPTAIFRYGDELAPMRHATEHALSDVDMAMIRPSDSVNVLCSEHGFAMLGGEAYAEILRTIRDQVIERTGATRVRLAPEGEIAARDLLDVQPWATLDTAHT